MLGRDTQLCEKSNVHQNGVLQNQKQSQRRAVKRKQQDEAVNVGQVSYPRTTGAGGGNSSVLALDHWQHPYANWAPNTMSHILISAPALRHGAASQLTTQIFEHMPSVIAPAVPLPRGGGRGFALRIPCAPRRDRIALSVHRRCAFPPLYHTFRGLHRLFRAYRARREGKFEASGGGHIVVKPPT